MYNMTLVDSTNYHTNLFFSFLDNFLVFQTSLFTEACDSVLCGGTSGAIGLPMKGQNIAAFGVTCIYTRIRKIDQVSCQRYKYALKQKMFPQPLKRNEM